MGVYCRNTVGDLYFGKAFAVKEGFFSYLLQAARQGEGGELYAGIEGAFPYGRNSLGEVDALKPFALGKGEVGYCGNALGEGNACKIFAGFKGGKGVATIAGAVVGIYPPAILLCLIVWFLSLLITHYVSFSSMLAGVMYPIFIMISPQTNHSIPWIIFSLIVAVLLIYTHRKNIKRLMAGEESKIYVFKKRENKK